MAFERFKALAPLLLSQSTEQEREILAGALDGNPESRRAALALASIKSYDCLPMSPALAHWLGEALAALDEAINRGGSLDDALSNFGYEKARGRPVADTLSRDLRVQENVTGLELIVAKSEAVLVVAASMGLSEATVWSICRRLKRISRGRLEDVNRPLLRRTVLENPRAYSKELRDFLAVTDSS